MLADVFTECTYNPIPTKVIKKREMHVEMAAGKSFLYFTHYVVIIIRIEKPFSFSSKASLMKSYTASTP